ncbi:MAG: glycosyltransferase [Sphingobacteriales bacterium]|nr:MAG: glycosyltransferase [Sphingobacteriales bacterium]
MRILVLCSRVPHPLHDGGNLAVSNLMEGLLDAGVRLSMLAMNTSRHHVDPQQLPPVFQRLATFKTVAVDNSIKPLAALRALISGTSYNLERFITAPFESELATLLEVNNYDIILLEGLYVTPYLGTIRQHSKAKVCYRQHNVEFQIWERLARNSTHALKRFYLGRLAKALKKYELKQLNDYDSIAAISPVDAKIYQDLGCTIPIVDIPYSLKVKAPVANQATPPPVAQFYHIGAMDWQPNEEAITWFLDKVWPLVIASAPGAQLFLAGRNMPAYFLKGSWPNVHIAGEVPDADAFEADKQVLVVPLHSGGGIRIKILEAMAKQKAVIATRVAMQGLHAATGGEEVLLADTPEDFAAACLALIDSPEQVQHLGKKARDLIQTYYNQHLVINKLLQHFNALL